MRGFEWRVMLCVLIIATIGGAVSTYTSDWSNFARAGSIIVVVGIYITWKDVAGKVDAARLTLHQIIENYRSEYSTRGHGLLAGISNQQLEEALSSTQQEVSDLLGVAKHRVKVIEALVIGLGTLLWGFGDLVGTL
ncbi:MAG: hypothetical protein ACREQ8_18990 [Woeseiaceae bacterium]